MEKDKAGYLRLKIDKNNRDELPLTTYHSLMSAKSSLFTLVEAFGLCQKLCGLFDTKGSCFQYKLKACKGACIGEEHPEEYNKRVLQATEPYRFDLKTFLVVDEGRTPTEKAVVRVEHGKYLGFGFIDFSLNENLKLDDLKACVKPYADNRDVQQIIRGHLKRHQSLEIIPYEVN